MKRAVLISVFALLVGVISFGYEAAIADEYSIEERFAPNTATVKPVSGTYNFDTAHTSIGFQVTHMGLISVPGYFKEFSGELIYDADNIEKSTVSFSAKTASVDTRVERRDNHLRSADFFDAEKHPEMTFKSTKVESNEKTLMVTGDFTLRGTTKSITIPVKVVGFKEGRGGVLMGAVSKTKINRSDYGVNYGLNNVSDEVRIGLNIEAMTKTEEAAKKVENRK